MPITARTSGKENTNLQTDQDKKEDIKDLLRNHEDFKLLSYPNLASKHDALRLSAAIFKPVPQWSGFMGLLTKDNTIIGKYKILNFCHLSILTQLTNPQFLQL